MFKLNQSSYTFGENDGHARITVIRVDGNDESHALMVKTTDESAFDGSNYMGGEYPVNMAKVSEILQYLLFSNETLAQTQNDFLAGKLWVHQRCVRYAPSENDGVDGEC